MGGLETRQRSGPAPSRRPQVAGEAKTSIPLLTVRGKRPILTGITPIQASMRVDKFRLLSVFIGTSLTPLAAVAQELPSSGLYQIVSGRFVECCGIAGPIPHNVPDDRQRFVRLEVDGRQVSMTILGNVLETFTKNVFCAETTPVRFSFPNGFVAPGSSNIVFHGDPGPFPNSQYVAYSVSFQGDRLIINGTAGVTTPFCSDVVNEFTHSDVLAVLLPKASLRISEYEVCWGSDSNRTYQVQYHSSLTSNAWMNLGLPVAGNGGTNCVADAIPPGEPKRSYRVMFVTPPLGISGQEIPTSGLYQIVTGTFTECCGIAGPHRVPLPNPSQSFVRLTVEPSSKRTRMTFLDGDMRTFTEVIQCPPSTPVYFDFDHGFPYSSNIVYHADPGPAPLFQYFSYTVAFSKDTLRIEGILGFSPGFCVDIPNRFDHSNVVAVLMPTATVRASQLEVCWNSSSNLTYQAQYRSALSGEAWMNLGLPVAGTGRTNCTTDAIQPEEPKRFYRVVTVP